MNNFNVNVVVSADDDLDGVVEVGVNWGAYGTVSIEEAEAFAQELQRAITEAKGKVTN